MLILDYFNKKKLLNPKETLSHSIPMWRSHGPLKLVCNIGATAAAKTPNYGLVHRNMYMYTLGLTQI